MSGTEFKRDATFERDVLRQTFVGDILGDLAAAAATRAAALAPDDPKTTGMDLHRSVYGDVELGPDGYRARVGATDFKANWFEEGASRVRPRPFIRPAVEEIVGPIEGDPR